MELMGGGVKVMTDEQMEVLRKQISVYATICDQLVDMHKALTATQDSLSISGMRMGNLYCDTLMTSGGHKITARQRWNPTPMQLQILESIFDNGNGTPNKQKIKEIATELSQHGQISETNVYNWFQNRRARSKRKQTPAPSHSGPETDTEVESKQEKTANSDTLPDQAQETLFNKSTGCFGTMSYYETILANPRMDQLMGKMEGYDIIR